MLDQPFQRFPGQIQAVEIGVAMFQLGHQPQRMGIVIEAADIDGHRIQRFLAGMAERRVAEIVRQRHVSARSSSSARMRARLRASCATSSEWVSRVR